MKKRDAQRTQVGAALVPMLQAARDAAHSHLAVLRARRGSDSRARRGCRRRQAGARADQFAGRQRRRGGARRLLALSQAAARRRRAALGAEADWQAARATRACSARPARACTPRRSTVDGKTLFVGSYNLDPRSTWLNCEQGVLVENADAGDASSRRSSRYRPAGARLAGDARGRQTCAGATARRRSTATRRPPPGSASRPG